MHFRNSEIQPGSAPWRSSRSEHRRLWPLLRPEVSNLCVETHTLEHSRAPEPPALRSPVQLKPKKPKIAPLLLYT